MDPGLVEAILQVRVTARGDQTAPKTPSMRTAAEDQSQKPRALSETIQASSCPDLHTVRGQPSQPRLDGPGHAWCPGWWLQGDGGQPMGLAYLIWDPMGFHGGLAFSIELTGSLLLVEPMY